VNFQLIENIGKRSIEIILKVHIVTLTCKSPNPLGN